MTTETASEFVSYSANAEDVLLRRLFPGTEPGFYVDVGAAHPIWESDTKALRDRGWRGINIEPQEEFLAELRRERPDDVNLGVALSDAPGELTFFEVEGTGLSTLDKHNAARAEAAGHRVKPRTVSVLTLAQVLAENNAPPTFGFLKIDVEGLEQAVLAGNDWLRFRPHVVMIEATVPETPIRRQDGCRALLTDVGWRHAWFDGLNDWYLAPEFEPPNGAFDAPPNVFDRYVARRTIEAEAQLAERRQATEARDGRIRELETDAEARMAEWRQATEARDGRIRQLETVAAARARGLSLLTDIIAESVRCGNADFDMKRILGHLRQSLANMGESAVGDEVCVTAAIRLLEADNARLGASLADINTDLKRHGKALSQVQHDLIAARQEVAEARATSNHFRELLSQAHAESATALAELAAAHVELHAMRTSTSWRVSEPVRALGRILRRR
ncbi:methyltransferase, FkbM family [Rhizobiales bacterium GAS191]|nr:methyltransferase, FkbM family [Rhizobiales bacterium GAS113]SEC19304.1 methyltransferase, FkbM family [Rhizobiales bacterium GAS188]SED04625.1 methyltransferase, FkbM family [Rhizobiales bacterium GAS191]